MIDYYFQSNEEDAEKAFKEAGIAFSGGFKNYVSDLMDYLAQEYNTPFSYFTGCTSPKEILDAFEDGLPEQEFADTAMASDTRNGANLIIYGDKRLAP